MPTREEKTTASTRWRVFLPVGLAATKKAKALSDTLAHTGRRLNKVQVSDKGTSFLFWALTVRSSMTLSMNVCVHMYVCMHVCMYVCMHVMYVVLVMIVMFVMHVMYVMHVT